MNKIKAMEIKKSLEDLVDSMPYMIEFEHQRAIMVKARFDSLIEAGFKEDQAIKICGAEYKS